MELVMEDKKKIYNEDESTVIQSLDESTNYYEKYIYRTLRNVEKAKEYSKIAQQQQDELVEEEANVRKLLIEEGQNPDEILKTMAEKKLNAKSVKKQ